MVNNMKRYMLYIFGALLVIIENGITNYFNIFDTSINLSIIYMAIISLYVEDIDVILISIFMGVLKDITIGGIFGINALTLFLSSIFINNLKAKIYRESNITIFALVFLITFFDSILNIIASSIVYVNHDMFNTIIKGLLIIPINNSIFSVIVFNIFKNTILKLKED